ncbi:MULTISPECIES: hypothetical protein [Thalassospira]|uniref:Trypsin n=1 Tax=Thalassospira profundimaris TaxID=502049 RepID=A0A367VJB9_9PROT|nr:MULTISPECIES: hypothetical protein [Thalassospira]KZB71036.1 hypothetical protein AUQ43_09380 [Thalassospira sp. MCCC 1A01148]RCK25318.1 hypothetical protein TH6_01460 [Thalassospira profundimaris]
MTSRDDNDEAPNGGVLNLPSAANEKKNEEPSIDYPMSDELKNAAQHAATIARLKFQGLERLLVPEAKSETATVSFIEHNNKTYAVTARHVIQTFNNLATQDGRQFEGYSCIQSPGVAILGPFITPPAQYPHPVPDIAICPVDNRLPAHIGKAAFEVRSQDDASWPISHALAIGFPTVEKHDFKDQDGRQRLALPCVYAVAEGLQSSGSSDQAQFHSELSELPTVVSLSGMSGGPVFWSDGSKYGLIGFIKEALDVTPKEGVETFYDEPKVNFICQRVDHGVIERWLQYVDENWQIERDKINLAIRNL